MKLIKFVEADGKTTFFDPLAVVCVSPLFTASEGMGNWFTAVFMGGTIQLEGDMDEFVCLVQKRRGV